MSNLTIINRDGKLLADSRQVADMVGKEHKHLLRDINGYKKILGQSNFGLTDFFIESSYISDQNRPFPCYLITKKGCDMVANKMTGEKGVLFTATYVTRFDEMEKRLIAPQIPRTLSEALRLAADQAETIEKQSIQLVEQHPKVLLADSVTASKKSILIGEQAKILKQKGIDIGQNRFFEWLREKGYLGKKSGDNYNLPTQKSMNMGLFEIKKTAINHSDGIRIERTAKVTGKGQLYFVNKFLQV